MYRKRLTLFCLAIWISPTLATATPEQVTFFENEVRPLLANNCFECHSATAKKLQAGLRVDSLKGILRGGDSGPAIEPGKPGESMIMSAVRYEDFEMPPGGKLAPKDVAILDKWISMGAPWPEEPEPKMGVSRQEFDWQQRKIEHWCWQAITPGTPPTVSDSAWPANPIDSFILAKLDAEKLSPAIDADKRTLIRRIYFDLIGLPPTPEQVGAFLDDESKYAYEKVVDELLKSPHFGEKWTRHWLDLVRYGETLGHEFDYPLRHAYQYRDYVIRAFNADVPYDQFVHEHVAGDLLEQPRMHPVEEFNESIIGTGFWYLGEACHSPTDVRKDEADRIDNQIDAFSKTFLGMTVACARCHDHKFDPIPTKDYYALSGFIQSSRRQEAMLDPHGKIRASRKKLEELSLRRRDVWQQALPFIDPVKDKIRAAIEAEIGSEDKAVIEALKQPTHPLHAMSKLGMAEDYAATSEQLRNDLASSAEDARKQIARTELYFDFKQDDLTGWYVTGEAFSDEPTQFGDQQQTQRKNAIQSCRNGSQCPVWDETSRRDAITHF